MKKEKKARQKCLCGEYIEETGEKDVFPICRKCKDKILAALKRDKPLR